MKRGLSIGDAVIATLPPEYDDYEDEVAGSVIRGILFGVRLKAYGNGATIYSIIDKYGDIHEVLGADNITRINGDDEDKKTTTFELEYHELVALKKLLSCIDVESFCKRVTNAIKLRGSVSIIRALAKNVNNITDAYKPA